MPIEFKRVGSTCERCGGIQPEAGEVKHYPEEDLLLCQKCGDELIKEKNQECSKCKKVVGLKGLTEHHGKQLCYQCIKDVKRNEVKTKERKSFLRKNWFKWIMISLTIITIVIAYIGLTSS